ncbi:MAG: hypothetical protein GY859_10465 [Desulfobacterales bacterium]|nr:hypothetical protein [Desulfobacterales bacterium]
MREDEPFFAEFPFDYRLRTAPLAQWLDASLAGPHPPPPDEIHDALYDEFYRKGRTPEGAFARTDKTVSRGLVVNAAELLAPLLEEMKTARALYREVRLGEFLGTDPPSPSPPPPRQFPPLPLTARTEDRFGEAAARPVELHGRLARAWKTADGRLHALVLTGSGKYPKTPDKYFLEPVLFYLACLVGPESARWIGEAGVTVHALYQEKLAQWSWRCDRDEAGERLTALVAEYLNQRDRAWLPFNIVAGLLVRLKPWDKPVDAAARHSFRLALEEAYAEEDAPSLARLINPEIPRDALDRALARFRIFLDVKRNK